MLSQRQTWKHYHQHPISHTTAHYLMTISEITAEDGYCRLTDLAKALEISAGSCHTTVGLLKKKRFITEDKNKFLKLSPKGKKVVESIMKNDELLTVFFNKILGVSEEQSEIDACKMEHLLSKELSAKLRNFVEFALSDSDESRAILSTIKTKSSHCAKSSSDCEMCDKECWTNT